MNIKQKYPKEMFWDNISEFLGYHVAKDGRVFSRRSNRTYGKDIFENFWREKTIVVDKLGRHNVTFRDLNSKVHNRRVHRLVLEAYVGPCPVGMECCHNDGDAGNNTLENLRWDTSKSNKADLRKHGKLVCGEKSQHSKLSESSIKEIIKLSAEGLPMKDVAFKFKVNSSTICEIIKGKAWKHINLNGEERVWAESLLENKSRKLKEEDVLEIFRLNKHAQSGVKIARLFKVSPETIYAILGFRTWKRLIVPVELLTEKQIIHLSKEAGDCKFTEL